MTRTPPTPKQPMTARQTYVVACLAGHGIGPEVTAAASRALARLGREHGFDVEELHPPFDTEALTRSGHPLPAATRRRDLERRRRARRRATRPPRSTGSGGARPRAPRSRGSSTTTGEATAFAPLHDDAPDWTLERAFATATRARRAGSRRSASTAAWRALVDRHAERHPGVEVEHVPLPEALRRLATGSAGVLVAEGVLGETRRGGAPRSRGKRRLVATGQLSPTGPGLFAPAHGTASDLAGQGVADPSAMLLATALLLSEGLGRIAAGRGARGQPHDGAPRAAAAVRRRRPRASRRRPASSSTRCSACCRARAATPSSPWESRDEDHGRRRDPPLARGGGRRGHVRDPRRGDHADLRRDGARDDRAPRARPPRAGRRATWRRATRARRARSASRSRPPGPGATNLVTPIADAWMDSTPLVCITGQVRVAPDRHRRLPGVRHHGHHDADRQALLARPGRRGDPRGDEGGVPRRPHRPLRARARRRPARHAGGA